MTTLLQFITGDRCRALLLLELEKLGLTYSIAELEESELSEIGSAQKYAILKAVLRESTISTVEQEQCVLVNRMKLTIIHAIRSDEIRICKFSVYLSTELHYNYSYLSNLFSRSTGSTVQHYIIDQKIKRAKELLLKDCYTLSEIAWMLHYSSVSHLSNQFKKVTGCTPTEFKLATGGQRKPYRPVKLGPMEHPPSHVHRPYADTAMAHSS